MIYLNRYPQIIFQSKKEHTKEELTVALAPEFCIIYKTDNIFVEDLNVEKIQICKPIDIRVFVNSFDKTISKTVETICEMFKFNSDHDKDAFAKYIKENYF